MLFGFLEVGVLKNVWSGPYKLKADLVETGITGGEVIATDENDFMRCAMGVVVNDFIDAGFENGIAGSKERAVCGVAFPKRAITAATGSSEEMSGVLLWIACGL